LRKRPNHGSFSDSQPGVPVQAFSTLKTPPRTRNSLFFSYFDLGRPPRGELAVSVNQYLEV
jgi:hypothetical protein